MLKLGSLRRTAAVGIALSVLLGLVPGAWSPAWAAPTDPVVRSGGANRIETAAANAVSFWDQADQAILATADNYPDALASWPLAARLDAPLLLTGRDQLASPTRNALVGLGVSTVRILGGEAVVGPSVEQALIDLGISVERLPGDDRFDTARLAALAAGPNARGEVLLALGAHTDPARGWPDATASGAFAALPDPPPVLLTTQNALPDATIQTLADLQTRQVTLLGGTAAIFESVADELAALGYLVERVAGPSRFRTSTAAVSDALSDLPVAPRPLIAASGRNFPDALTAGPLAAHLGATLQLVPPDDLASTPHLHLFLRSLRGQVSQLIIVGGPAAIGDRVAAQLARALDLDGGSDPAPVTDLPDDFRPTQDVVVAGGVHDLASISIPPGVTVTVDGSGEFRSSGPVEVDGALASHSGGITINTNGALTVDGILHATTQSPDEAGDAALGAQPTGIRLVAAGPVTIGPEAALVSNGAVVVTDDAAQLDRTPDDVDDEAATASGDLPTLVPLPPEDPVFMSASTSAPQQVTVQQSLPPHVVTGVIDASHPMPGARRVMLFRFRGDRELRLQDLDILGPHQRAAAPLNPPDGDSGSGRDGRRGPGLTIWNNGGPIRVVGLVTLQLADGQAGQSVITTCAPATGGAGGTSGPLRMTAAGGIDVQGGNLLIVPGSSGNGGDATSLGLNGCDTTATGGAGADDRKRLYARGNVQGLANVTLGSVFAGSGGVAFAIGGDGADGAACEAGDAGGDATATGGPGGAASVSVGGLPVATTSVWAGSGGAGRASAGSGGNGGDCDGGGPGGAGGAGGAATAGGGDGGTADGPGPVPGSGGDAEAVGGQGGKGGNGCSEPENGPGGAGGDGGGATATAGADRGAFLPPADSFGGAGDGGVGGDGTDPGAGGIGGEGIGAPTDIPDGLAGADGKPCAPPEPPPEEGA